MDNKLVKYGAIAGIGLAGLKYIDDKFQIRDDLKFIQRISGLRSSINEARNKKMNFVDGWYRTCKKFKNKNAILFHDKVYTFSDTEKLSNKVAHWLLSKGVKPGDTIAVIMENRPEFLFYEIGISKVGAKCAFINTSIKQKGLIHCVTISECKMLIFGKELTANVSEVADDFKTNGIQLYCEDNCIWEDTKGIDVSQYDKCEFESMPDSPVDPNLRKGISMMDVFGYIYTSGTTGLPKAAIILHQKTYLFSGMTQYGFLVKPEDTVYTCLPLFHSAGGGLGAGMMFFTGTTIAIRRKFSAREFWNDVVKYDATIIQYIGELCRYLVLQPKNELENKHHLRIAIGNGLRPEIWDEFQDRFNIPEVGEFYGATEGNGALLNHCTSKEARGACGKLGALAMKLQGSRLVKFDVVEEEPVRDQNGRCIDCDFNEPGELLFPIKDNDPGTAFVGYKNKKATKKKILENAFVEGDKYFRTGDLLARNEKGYFKFVDRIGDTFRWKGENCSTTEVTQVMATFPGVEEVNVYGVQIPNNMDGRAPTAAITPTDGDLSKIDLKALAKYARKNLPSYAVPLFLRILPQMEVTATMKHQKVKLRKQGIDITQVEDRMFYFNNKTKEYEPFGPEEYKKVTQPSAKL